MLNKFTIVILCFVLGACVVPKQGNPEIDRLKDLAFVCEQYRVILTDIRTGFRAGLIKKDIVLLSDVVLRKPVGPFCDNSIPLPTGFTKEQAARTVSSAMKAFALRRSAM